MPIQRVALKAANGKYVAAELTAPRIPLSASRDVMGAWEIFDLVDPQGAPLLLRDGSQVALRASNGQYVVAEIATPGIPVRANRAQIGAWEIWRAEQIEGNRWAFKAENGKYLCADLGLEGAPLVANRSARQAWETFELTDPTPGPVPAPPAIRITDYAPQHGASPLVVRAVWAREPGSGPIAALHWLKARELGWWEIDAKNDPADPDHHYRFLEGTWYIALKAIGPGGTAQTQAVRRIDVLP